ncbi:hypothetical protein JCM5296_004623 [Sporobolomyces johnsonii]
MRTTITAALIGLTQLAGVLAFPWMGAPGAEEATMEYLHARGLATGAGGGNPHLTGLSTAGAQNVDPSDLRPDADHQYIAPGPTDQRGPCPGLNVLANYGYIPRNGIVNAQQAIQASYDVFNMDYDLGTFLTLQAVALGGNLLTQTFSIGGEDDRTYSDLPGVGSKLGGALQYGLDFHGTVEGDMSVTRGDFYTNNGDNHSGLPARFANLIALAKQNGGVMDHAAVNQLFGQNAKETLANDPTFYVHAHTLVVIMAEYSLIPELYANGTLGNGGVANYDSIAPLMGFQTNPDGSVCAVPERFPPHWYRRATPYGLVDGVVPHLIPTLMSFPGIPNPIGDYFNTDNIGELGCALLRLFEAGMTPEQTGQSATQTAAINAFISSTMIPALPDFLTCEGITGLLPTANMTTQTLPTEGFRFDMQETGPGGNQQYTCGASNSV